MNRRTADKVQLLDSDFNPVEIERRDDVQTVCDLAFKILTYILLMAIGGGFVFMALVAFFGGAE